MVPSFSYLRIPLGQFSTPGSLEGSGSHIFYIITLSQLTLVYSAAKVMGTNSLYKIIS